MKGHSGRRTGAVGRRREKRQDRKKERSAPVVRAAAGVGVAMLRVRLLLSLLLILNLRCQVVSDVSDLLDGVLDDERYIWVHLEAHHRRQRRGLSERVEVSQSESERHLILQLDLHR